MTQRTLATAPAIGTKLMYLPTGEVFSVLCSCPRSKPRHHTRSYIQRNLQLFAYPPSPTQEAANAT